MSAWWFAPESPRLLAPVRIVLGAVLLWDAASRWPYAVELYSRPGTPMPLLPGTAFLPPECEAATVVVLHSLFCFAAACATVGWRTRTSLVAAAVGLTGFGLLDHVGTFKKFSVILGHALLLLACSRCGAAWSVDSLLDPRGRLRCPTSPAWPHRLIQLLVCSIYFGAAATKLRMSDFGTGDLVEFSLLDDRWGGGWFGMWLAVHPTWLGLASLATLLFELWFPLLVWLPRWRRTMLAAAFLFHAGLHFTLAISIFSPVMCGMLLAFVDARDREAIVRLLRRCGVALGAAAKPQRNDEAETGRLVAAARVRPGRTLFVWGAYLAAGACCAVGGLAWQRSNDAYGAFQPAERTFAVLDRDTVDALLEEPRLPVADHVHRVELGSRIAAFHAFGASHVFRTGETVHLLARFVVPHPPYELQASLAAPDGQVLERVVHALDATATHASVGFRLTDALPNGRYEIVLRANGFDVARREFVLEGSKYEDEAGDEPER